MRGILVFDIGTGGVHVNIIDNKGDFVASAYEEIRYKYLPESDGLDWNPEDTWRSSLRAAETALAQAGVKDGKIDIAAIAVTSQRHGAALVDDSGKVYLGAPNLDARAKDQARRIGERYGQDIYNLTSRWPDVYFPSMRLMWLRDNHPQDYRKVTRILMINEYVMYRLTGRMVSEWTNAAETLLMDVGRLSWSDDMKKLFGFDHIGNNEIVSPGDAVGVLLPEVGLRLGLGATPVVAAVSDTQAAALGSGMVKIGDVVAVNGSTTPVLMIEDHFLKDPLSRIWVDPYIKGLWALESNCLQSGMVHRRLMDHLTELIRLLPGQENFTRDQLYNLLDRLEDKTDGVVSYMGSRRFHVSKSEANPRLHISFPNAETNIFAAILPSFMENLAFAVARNLEQLEEISGRAATRLCLTGGGSRSRHFKRLVPALMPGRKVMVTRDLETTSRGAAIQGWIAAGEFKDADEAVSFMSSGGWYEDLPPGHSSKLLERYEMWKEMYDKR